MTPKERVFAALSRREPDRLPVLELAIDWKVMRGLGFRDYFRMVEALDLDAVPVNQVLYLLGWRKCLGPAGAPVPRRLGYGLPGH